jgi:hypothetical protein
LRISAAPHAIMPALVAGIHVFNTCAPEDVDGRDKPDKDANVDAIVARAQDVSAVSNSIQRGIPVQIVAGG